MTTREVIDGIRSLMARHEGEEKDLYNALLDEAEVWKMRLEELEDEE